MPGNHLIKCILGIVILLCLASAVWFAWLTVDNSRFDSLALTPEARTKKSPLIVYAVAKRDEPGSPFVIQQIWKDARKLRTPLTGSRIPEVMSNNLTNRNLDGVVVFYGNDSLNPEDLESFTLVTVQDGMVEDTAPEQSGELGEIKTSLEQYKRNCGL